MGWVCLFAYYKELNLSSLFSSTYLKSTYSLLCYTYNSHQVTKALLWTFFNQKKKEWFLQCKSNRHSTICSFLEQKEEKKWETWQTLNNISMVMLYNCFPSLPSAVKLQNIDQRWWLTHNAQAAAHRYNSSPS